MALAPLGALPAAELDLAGGWISLSPLPGRGGDLAGDLAALRGWGADLLITLVEPAELPTGFALQVQAAGLSWLQLPVPDFGLPTSDALAQALPGVLARLRAGQRVALHCMGGCGRSGMVALRLMVLAGERPEAALARLRAARPCAVETEAQRLWASAEPGVPQR